MSARNRLISAPRPDLYMQQSEHTQLLSIRIDVEPNSHRRHCSFASVVAKLQCDVLYRHSVQMYLHTCRHKPKDSKPSRADFKLDKPLEVTIKLPCSQPLYSNPRYKYIISCMRLIRDVCEKRPQVEPTACKSEHQCVGIQCCSQHDLLRDCSCPRSTPTIASSQCQLVFKIQNRSAVRIPSHGWSLEMGHRHR